MHWDTDGWKTMTNKTLPISNIYCQNWPHILVCNILPAKYILSFQKIMVRYKKRYFVIEYDRASHVSKDKCELDLEPLNSKDIDVANAIKHKILELHGDFGRAATTVGLKVIYANMNTRLVIVRCRHGPHTLVASSLPFVTKIKNDSVVGKLLYTGATIRHCHKFMLKRQQVLLEKAKVMITKNKEEILAEIMTINNIDPL